MPDLASDPPFELLFTLWHLVAGSFAIHLVNRRRFGQDSHQMLTGGGSSRNDHIVRAQGAISLLWLVAIGLHGTSASFRAHPLGQDLLTLPAWVGWCITVPCHVGVLVGQLGMGRSFRIGRGRGTRDAPALVERGLHRWSRNPIYLCCVLFLVGQWTWNPGLLCGGCVVGISLCFHLQTLEEEVELEALLGEPYRRYLRDVPRYLGWPRRS